MVKRTSDIQIELRVDAMAFEPQTRYAFRKYILEIYIIVSVNKLELFLVISTVDLLPLMKKTI